MSLTLTAISVAVPYVLIAIWIKRTRGRRVIEHSITPEDLHSLLASNQEVRLFDVRQPLDLLADVEIIPGAKRIPPEKYLRTPRSSQEKKNRSLTVPAPAISSQAITHRALGMDFHRVKVLKVDWRPGRRSVIRSSHAESPSTSTLQLADASVRVRNGQDDSA
jgi:rhodanese-related sulfurtransferase